MQIEEKIITPKVHKFVTISYEVIQKANSIFSLQSTFFPVIFGVFLSFFF